MPSTYRIVCVRVDLTGNRSSFHYFAIWNWESEVLRLGINPALVTVIDDRT